MADRFGRGFQRVGAAMDKALLVHVPQVSILFDNVLSQSLIGGYDVFFRCMTMTCFKWARQRFINLFVVRF